MITAEETQMISSFAQIGFSFFVAGYLMIRLEKVIDTNTVALIQLKEEIKNKK